MSVAGIFSTESQISSAIVCFQVFSTAFPVTISKEASVPIVCSDDGGLSVRAGIVDTVKLSIPLFCPNLHSAISNSRGHYGTLCTTDTGLRIICHIIHFRHLIQIRHVICTNIEVRRYLQLLFVRFSNVARASAGCVGWRWPKGNVVQMLLHTQIEKVFDSGLIFTGVDLW